MTEVSGNVGFKWGATGNGTREEAGGLFPVSLIKSPGNTGEEHPNPPEESLVGPEGGRGVGCAGVRETSFTIREKGEITLWGYQSE